VLPFGRKVTLGDALTAVDLKKAAGPDIDDDDDVADFGDAPPATSGNPPRSTEPPPAASSSPGEDEDPDSFAQLAGKVATSVGIGVLTSIHRRRGFEPAELDDDEVERLETETVKVVRRGIGDKQIPWWAPVVSAWGMAYFSMGNGARPLGTPIAEAAGEAAPAPGSAPPPMPPPAPATSGYRPPAKPEPIRIQGTAPRVA
jgi:hypothetical protein